MFRLNARRIRSKRNKQIERLWKQLHAELEPINRDIKNEVGGFPHNNRNILWDELVFNSAIHMYYEALACYSANILQASTIMCRDAIDSALYLACTTIWSKDLQTESRASSARTSKKEWHWGDLKKEALRLNILTKDEIEQAEKIRELGHFSAHLATRQDASFREWNREHETIYQEWHKQNEQRLKQNLSPNPSPVPREGFRLWIAAEEAFQTLELTQKFLIRIVQRFFKNDQTRIRKKDQ